MNKNNQLRIRTEILLYISFPGHQTKDVICSFSPLPSFSTMLCKYKQGTSIWRTIVLIPLFFLLGINLLSLVFFHHFTFFYLPGRVRGQFSPNHLYLSFLPLLSSSPLPSSSSPLTPFLFPCLSPFFSTSPLLLGDNCQ